jgi:hypothetical protein
VIHGNNNSFAGIPVNYPFHPNVFTYHHVQLLFPVRANVSIRCFENQ